MNLKNRKIRACDLNQVSHRICSCIYMYKNAVTVLCYSYIYDMIFITQSLKIKQIICSLRVPPHAHKGKILGMHLMSQINSAHTLPIYLFRSNIVHPSTRGLESDSFLQVSAPIFISSVCRTCHMPHHPNSIWHEYKIL